MIRLLVVDDQDLIRDGLAAILDLEEGLEVVGTAGDGAAAVTQARRLRPDVTLMDIRMPGTDGLDATRQLMSQPEPSTRVVVLTTFDDDDSVLTALRYGASGFLLKDLPRAQLVDGIRAVHGGDLRLSPSITRRLVEQRAGRAADPRLLAGLSEREKEVLTLVARGRTNTEIAAELFLSESTVKSHVGRLLTKVAARDRVQLVITAYDAGLVP